MTDATQTAEIRRVAIAALLAAIDGRDEDLHKLLADADIAALIVMAGGLAMAVSAAFGEVPAERRAEFREQLAACALDMAAWPQ